MNCVSCESPRRVNWSPLFNVYVCSFCLDKMTDAELRNTTRLKSWTKAHGGDKSNILGVPPWLV